jgi:hypothetical protein
MRATTADGGSIAWLLSLQKLVVLRGSTRRIYLMETAWLWWFGMGRGVARIVVEVVDASDVGDVGASKCLV